MAKFYRSTIVTVLTYKEDSGYPDQAEYRVRALGRGRWYVEREDGYHWVARTAELQRFFRPEAYASGYYSSGEPVLTHEEVYITRV